MMEGSKEVKEVKVEGKEGVNPNFNPNHDVMPSLESLTLNEPANLVDFTELIKDATKGEY